MIPTEVVPGVEMYWGRGLNPNVYVIDRTLIDTVPWWGRRRLVRLLSGAGLKAHVLQHAHPPTAGSSRAVADVLDVPVYCGSGDLEALKSARYHDVLPPRVTTRAMARTMPAPPVPWAEAIEIGSTVGDFEVLAAPGHSPGHLAFWREVDRVLLVGDVITNETLWTRRKGLHEPPPALTLDQTENIRSALRLARLEPRVVLFTHGRPLLEGHRFKDFVAARAERRLSEASWE